MGHFVPHLRAHLDGANEVADEEQRGDEAGDDHGEVDRGGIGVTAQRLVLLEQFGPHGITDTALP